MKTGGSDAFFLFFKCSVFLPLILPNVQYLTFPNAACCCPGRLALLRMHPQLVLWFVSVTYQTTQMEIHIKTHAEGLFFFSFPLVFFK